MSDTFHSTEWNTIKLDGILWPIRGVVGYRNLARFENRIVTGDPSKDDDELLSTKVWSDFSGGCGIFDEKEGADQGTFWDCQGLDIDHPGQLALGPKAQTFTISGTNAFALGQAGGKFHVSFDKNIYEWTEATDTFADTTYNLGFDPVNKGVYFNSDLWVPQGSNGYQTFTSGSGVTAGTVGITATAFTVCDNKLFCIEHNNQLSFYNPTTAAWTSPAEAKVPNGSTVRDIITYPNRSDEPAVWVMTTDGLWGYDDVTQTLKSTSMILPKHPQNGRGMAVWRVGETMHIASGMGVYSWTGPGGVASPIGLDRRQGVPIEYNGYITDLAPTNNHLWALIHAEGTGSTYHSLYRYNGQGWARMWAAANKTDTINWIQVSNVSGVQRIWWDVGNDIYSMEIPIGFANPREINRGIAGNYDTANAGYMITSWFDANMKTFDKLYVYKYVDLSGNDGLGINFIFQEQDDKTDTSWGTPFSVQEDGLTYQILDFSSPNIRWRYELSTSTTTQSVILDSGVLKYMKVPVSLATFQVTFDMTAEGMIFTSDPQKRAHDLETLLTKRTLILAELNQNQFYLRVSNLQGWDGTAEDRKKSRTVTFVQIPVPVFTDLVPE